MEEQFGRYILLERIAIGGMAEIFKAKAPGLGGFEKILAIKRLHPRYSQDADFIEMLIDEARITVELAHGNIGQIFDLGRCEDHYFIAMEHIDGRDLYRVMKRLKELRRPWPINGAAYVAMEACSGLDYAHRKKDRVGRALNIIHRDVSPQNVLLSFEGDCKLVDFGIAKAALRAYETEAGIIKGKFYYMSPEQAKGEPLDHRTDIFSLGIVLYEMLTGELLYKDEDDITLLSRVRRADIRPPSELRSDVPRDLERIVMWALGRDRDERFPSARHMQRELAEFIRRADRPFGKDQLGRMMRALFLGESGEESLDIGGFGPEGSSMDRDQFGRDQHSVIQMRPQAPPAAIFGDGDEETDVQNSYGATIDEPESLDDDDLIVIESGEVMLLDDDEMEETINVDGGAISRQAFDSIEVSSMPKAAFAPFENEATQAFSGRSSSSTPAERAAVVRAAPDAPSLPRAVPQMSLAGGPSARTFQAEPTPAPFAAAHPRSGPSTTSRLEAVARAATPQASAGSSGEFNQQPTVIVQMDEKREAAPKRARRGRRGSPLGAEPPTPLAALPRGRIPRGVGLITRERLIVAAAILLAVGAATTITVIAVSDDPKPADIETASDVPSDAANATLEIRSEPSGAQVKVGSEWLFERTPTRKIVPIGQMLRIRVALGEDYEPFDLEVDPEPGQLIPINARLKKISGMVTIESRPSGAAVYIGDRNIGRTPVTWADLPIDQPVRIRLEKDGFEPVDKVHEWRGRRELTVETRLEPIAADPEPFELAPTRRSARAKQRKARARARARAQADSADDPPPRRSRDRADIDDRNRDRDRPSSAAAGDTESGIGYLSVQARQWGSVFLDDNQIALETPVIKYKVPAGEHTVHVCFGGDRSNKSRKKQVSIQRGQTTLVKF